MGEILRDLGVLYRDALVQTLTSLRRAWIGMVAIYTYALALYVVGMVAQLLPFGILAGLAVAIADAFAVGALLALVERGVKNHALRLSDIGEAVGTYAWDVIGVGFVLWIPFMLLGQFARMGGVGPPILAITALLAAVFLNPLPEVIYQSRTGSPLEDLAESARFVQQHWIEWFLPIVLVAAPLGSFLFLLPGSLVRGGLSFFGSLLTLPALFTKGIADALGLPPGASFWFVALAWPVVAFALLLFRGHLFATLAGTSRRQRAFRRRVSG
jgi:hypothetical protein